MAGWILKNGADTGSGIRPSLTIGSEKTTVISRDSPRSDVSPPGRPLTTVSAFWARAGAHRKTHSKEVANAIRIRMVWCEEGGSERLIGGRAHVSSGRHSRRTCLIGFDTG